jgi:hypothetical protein
MDSDKLAEDEPKCSEMVQLTCMDGDQLLSTASCKQKLIVVICTSGKSETNHIVAQEEGGDDSCCRTQGTLSVCKETWDKAPSRFAWLDHDVLLVSLCYSMTGFIFIITGNLATELHTNFLYLWTQNWYLQTWWAIAEGKLVSVHKRFLVSVLSFWEYVT